MQNYSYIDAAITNLGGYDLNNKDAELVTMIQSQPHDEPANRIALTFIDLNTHRSEAKKSRNEYSGVKPERLLSFVQKVMNRVVRDSYYQNVTQSAEEEKEIVNGIDFSSDIAEHLNVEQVDTAKIAELVTDDYHTLFALHSWLANKCSYLDSIEDFYFYVDLYKDGDEWVRAGVADNYDEACNLVQLAAERREEQAAVDNRESVANMSFKSEWHDIESDNPEDIIMSQEEIDNDLEAQSA